MIRRCLQLLVFAILLFCIVAIAQTDSYLPDLIVDDTATGVSLEEGIQYQNAIIQGTGTFEQGWMNIEDATIMLSSGIVDMTNANQVKIDQAGIIEGVAQRGCVINGVTFNEGTRFRYDVAAAEIVVEPGSAILVSGVSADTDFKSENLGIGIAGAVFVLNEGDVSVVGGQLKLKPGKQATINGVQLNSRSSEVDIYFDELDHSGDYINFQNRKIVAQGSGFSAELLPTNNYVKLASSQTLAFELIDDAKVQLATDPSGMHVIDVSGAADSSGWATLTNGRYRSSYGPDGLLGARRLFGDYDDVLLRVDTATRSGDILHMNYDGKDGLTYDVCKAGSNLCSERIIGFEKATTDGRTETTVEDITEEEPLTLVTAASAKDYVPKQSRYYDAGTAKGEVEDYVRQRARAAGIDPDVMATIIRSESGFNPAAINRNKRTGNPIAVGLAQVTKTFLDNYNRQTGNTYSHMDMTDAKINMDAATYMMKKYQNDFYSPKHQELHDYYVNDPDYGNGNEKAGLFSFVYASWGGGPEGRYWHAGLRTPPKGKGSWVPKQVAYAKKRAKQFRSKYLSASA